MDRLTSTFEEVKLTYRNKVKADDRPVIKDASSAYKVLIRDWDKDQIALLEEFKLLLMDRKNRVMSIAPISKGGMHGTFVDPKIAFMIALKRRASGIIMAHNHPSGNLKPSEADIRLTDKFVKGGKLLEIPILDHLIVTEESYYSMANEGLI